jgi:hypothetical protein
MFIGAADTHQQGPDDICSHTTGLTTPMYCNECFNLVNLASFYSALPDDGDYTETCWSCFNVNFNTPFKAILLRISGDKTLILLPMCLENLVRI